MPAYFPESYYNNFRLLTGGKPMQFNNLETERLLLKNIGPEDRAFIYKQFSDPVVSKYLYDAEPVVSMGDADDIIEMFLQPEIRTHHRWILIRKSDNVKIGTCGFHCWNVNTHEADVGYDLQEAYCGQGYMQEALNAIFAYAKEQMGLLKVTACISVENKGSIGLAKKLGFVRSGEQYNEVFRDQAYLHDKYVLML